jgi:hypothetical protein
MGGKQERPGDDHLRGILEAMRARGEKITVNTFIAAADGGDRTYMSAFLANWRQEVAEREGAVLTEPSPTLIGVLRGIERQICEVYAFDLARRVERHEIVEREFRARADAAAAAAARRIGDLEIERAALQEQIGSLGRQLQEERQRAGEHLLQVERLQGKLDVGESAAARERDTLHAVLTRLERDLAHSSEQLRGAEEARSVAVHERESLARQLAEREQQQQRERETLLQKCKEEQAARAELARRLRQCREGNGDQAA